MNNFEQTNKILDLVDCEGNLVVACSGGADSISLLHYLKENFFKVGCKTKKNSSKKNEVSKKQISKNQASKKVGKKNNKIICAHFDHRWSNESKVAKKLVEDFCSKFSIEFECGLAKTKGKTSEAVARAQRYEFLKKITKKHSAKIVFTAHHADDQVETFFLRLLRGTGSEGLCCIKEERELAKGIKLVRPFLSIRKSEILEYCRKHKLKFFEDPSNQYLEIKRNLIRKELIPLFEKVDSNFHASVSNLIDIVSEEQKYLSKQFEDLPKQAFKDSDSFLSQSVAMQRLIIKKLLEQESLATSFELIERLRDKIADQKNHKLSLSSDLFFVCSLSKGSSEKPLNPLDRGLSLSASFPCQGEGTQRADGVSPQIETFSEAPKKKKREFEIAKRRKEKKRLPFPETEINIKNLPKTGKYFEIDGFGKLLVQKQKKKLSLIPKNKNSYKVHLDLSFMRDGDKLILRTRREKDKFQAINASKPARLKNFLINRKVKKRRDQNQVEHLPLLTIKNSSDILWIPGVEVSESVKVTGSSTHVFEYIPE